MGVKQSQINLHYFKLIIIDQSSSLCLCSCMIISTYNKRSGFKDWYHPLHHKKLNYYCSVIYKPLQCGLHLAMAHLEPHLKIRPGHLNI